MRTFRPKSWQAQARRLGDNLYHWLTDDDLESNERQVIKFFADGYTIDISKQRRKYVEQRAAKRVCRLIRKGNER